MVSPAGPFPRRVGLKLGAVVARVSLRSNGGLAGRSLR
ncbi:Hypothetical protein AA314_09500 [Archangium gephyra]|uniref:Uncharacterized protein n=1 Tax=Archangium gephyra TaxID=48 RepID=A0AAC8QI09_9BACT|nr:Hypothetical protein AA314_09500 [Archangium gephyra]